MLCLHLTLVLAHSTSVNVSVHALSCLCTLKEYMIKSKCADLYWRRKWQSTPVLLPGKSHGQRSLVGYSPWGPKESDMTERLHLLT